MPDSTQPDRHKPTETAKRKRCETAANNRKRTRGAPYGTSLVRLQEYRSTAGHTGTGFSYLNRKNCGRP